jgi:serine/threonine protein kinase
LSTSLVRVFTAQLLDALSVLNEAKIIHCDLNCFSWQAEPKSITLIVGDWSLAVSRAAENQVSETPARCPERAQ